MHVQHHNDGLYTRHTYVGEPGLVMGSVSELFRNYPRAGYGTMIDTVVRNEDGSITVRVSHANSCD